MKTSANAIKKKKTYVERVTTSPQVTDRDVFKSED